MAGFADFIVRLALDSKKFSSGADKAKADVKGMIDQFDKGGAVLGRFGDILHKLTGGAGILGAGAGGFMLGRYAQKAAGDLNDLADSLDTTADMVQRLQNAAGNSGLKDFGLVEGGVKFVRKSQSEALQGNKSSIDDFAAIGVSLDDIRNKSGAELFLQIAKGVETGAINAANFSSYLAIVGREANALVPAFKDGFATAAEGLNAFSKSGAQVVNDLDEMDKTWTKLFTKLKSGGAWLATGLTGGISSLSKLIIGTEYAVGGDKETASDILAERELMNDSGYGDSLTASTRLEKQLANKKGAKSAKAKQEKDKADKASEDAKKLRDQNTKKLSELRVSALPKSAQQFNLEQQSQELQDKIAKTPAGVEREKLKAELLEVESRLAGVKPDTKGALTVSARAGDNLTRQGLFSGPAESAAQRAAVEQVGILRQQLQESRRTVDRLERINRTLTSIE